MKVWLGAGAALVVVVAVTWQQSVNVEVEQPLTRAATASFSGEKHSPLVQQSLLASESLAQLKTFQGAQVDGALRTDHKGKLVIDMQLRHWIDFHLSAQGELALDEIVLYMQQQMRVLPEPGQSQALSLLEDYLGYLNALGRYDSEENKRITDPSMSDLAARLAWQQRLRREWLEPEVVAAFFEAEEKIDEYTLAKIQLRNDGATAEDLAALEQTLPEPVQQMRKESRQLLAHSASEAQLRSEGASAEEIQAWRMQEYGAAAAQRLADLDKRNAQWHKRLQDYQRYQQSQAVQKLAQEDQQKLLQTYRSKNFSENEQKRLSAALQLMAGGS